VRFVGLHPDVGCAFARIALLGPAASAIDCPQALNLQRSFLERSSTGR
jgi:hypothetical protein